MKVIYYLLNVFYKKCALSYSIRQNLRFVNKIRE